MDSGVYLITCTANGATYVGSTQDFAKRWSAHLQALKTGRHCNPMLQGAWNKYGDLKFEVLEHTGTAYLLSVEQSYLDYYRRRPKSMNMAAVAGAPMRGLKHTPQARQKMSRAGLGRPKSAATRESMSRAQLGRKRTSAQLEAVREENRRRRVVVERVDPLTGEIREYASLYAARNDGFHPGAISNVLGGKSASHRGFWWKRQESVS